MKPANLFFLVAMCVVCLLAGCASSTTNQAADRDGFAGISTIHLIDDTDPMYLNETEAKTFHDLLGKGLVLKGYEICEKDCNGDIKIRSNISKYQYEMTTKSRFMAGGIAVMNVALINVDIAVEKNGKVIKKYRVKRKEPMDLKTATFNLATWFLKTIPQRM